jgi:hypothetical protein
MKEEISLTIYRKERTTSLIAEETVYYAEGIEDRSPYGSNMRKAFGIRSIPTPPYKVTFRLNKKGKLRLKRRTKKSEIPYHLGDVLSGKMRIPPCSFCIFPKEWEGLKFDRIVKKL